MGTAKQVIIIGFDPAVVDYSAWPELNPQKVLETLQREKARLIELGYDTKVCLVDLGETAENEVRQALSGTVFDCVVIGAGVRKSEEHFLLFEKLINVVHHHAPKAHICFNTNPTDTVAAVQRWV